MARRKIGIEEQILDYVQNGPVAAVELTLRLANAQFRKRTGVLTEVKRRVRKPKAEPEPASVA